MNDCTIASADPSRIDDHQIDGVLRLSVGGGDGDVPLVLDSPHSGTAFPLNFRPALEPTLVLRTADLFVGRLFDPSPDVGAAFLEALFPRAYIDVNRAIDDLDQALIQTTWPELLKPTEKSRLGKGLIWRLAAGGRSIYARRLTEAEIRERIEVYYKPYHTTLRAVLDDRHRRFGQVWHINCHSMKSMSTAHDAEGAGIMRNDIVISDRDGASADAAFVERVRELLAGEGLKVAINDPFKGAEVVRRHGEPAAGRHSIQVEVNRALYMNERTLQTDDGFDNIRCILGRMVRIVAEDCRSRC